GGTGRLDSERERQPRQRGRGHGGGESGGTAERGGEGAQAGQRGGDTEAKRPRTDSSAEREGGTGRERRGEADQRPPAPAGRRGRHGLALVCREVLPGIGKHGVG
ncbi:hypothetical protein C3R30_21710, partial [Mycobacterium tuberculosis]